MSRIPRSYEAFATAHFRLLNQRDGVTWSDACPAYALAYLTFSAYGPQLDPADAWEVEAQWDELRGTSDLDWTRAFKIVRDAWTHLASRIQSADVAS